MLIMLYDTINNGYNITLGGEGCLGYKHLEESKQKMRGKRPSISGKRHPLFGKHLSESTKEKISKANTNPSVETRRKMSKNHFDVTGANNPFFGKHHTEETKEIIRRKKIGVSAGEKNYFFGKHFCGTASPSHRKVEQLDFYGNTIRIWDYMKQAADELNIDPSGITACCRGRQKSAFGYIWRYID